MPHEDAMSQPVTPIPPGAGGSSHETSRLYFGGAKGNPWVCMVARGPL